MRATRFALVAALTASPAGPLAAQQPATRVIEEMTWTEIRDAIAAGNTIVIVPVGGTEQNGPHMVMGKHNYVVTFAAKRIADRLGNALVAPTVQFVPQGNYDSPGFGDKPGVLSNPSPSYENLLEAAARSLKVHGFTDILFIGDSGGNQNGMSAVADKLNQEWAGTVTKVYAVTDYYRKGQEHTRAWLQAQFGYDMATIGSHAGITDTSAMMYVFPDGIRTQRIVPFGGGPDMGVRGDPSKATAEIGRMVIEFKVNAAITHYTELKAPPRGRGRGPGMD
jgi:creatinine amidohydrolase/Fe(II)-dependent formamide hydrolase-like protein